MRWAARFAVAKRSIPAVSRSTTFPDSGEILLSGGVRGGAATLFYPMWHLEVESLLVLKNNRGVEGNRVRHMDYGYKSTN